ncbi:iron-sulfur cluster biogenesis protein [Schizosaccharomyces japonicus yFS275]|uniref:Iron-sulfur cluster biogenesis protein n=1 Tax=Schizosaccharomyces japonicus (strain yFS275 / FY16936) TaxID=402676 RepID=B6K242_SCHJY|nr:iron-sulfur cluster biogenesis protein [Schizosaccharomyces japonicus yFS275]EEB07223.2 iron-sulfur cluster biogenesis protein [Schizosaccharomyces japonicus yFS275]
MITGTFSRKLSNNLNKIRLPQHTRTSFFADRRLVFIEGIDTVKFLQGLAANKVVAGEPKYSAFLNAKGRVLFDALLYPLDLRQRTQLVDNVQGQGDAFAIEIDATRAAAFLQHLQRFQLRAKVRLAPVDPSRWCVQATWNDTREDSSDDGLVDTREHLITSPLTQLWDPRFPETNNVRRAIVPPTSAPAQELSMEAYKAFRIQKGVAEGQREIISGEAFPLESNFDKLHGVHFQKGCYLGQELTYRSYQRGTTRKRILPFQLSKRPDDFSKRISYSSSPFSVPAANELSLSEATGTDASTQTRTRRGPGRVLTTQGNIGLGLIRLDYIDQVLRWGELFLKPYRPPFLLDD